MFCFLIFPLTHTAAVISFLLGKLTLVYGFICYARNEKKHFLGRSLLLNCLWTYFFFLCSKIQKLCLKKLQRSTECYARYAQIIFYDASAAALLSSIHTAQ